MSECATLNDDTPIFNDTIPQGTDYVLDFQLQNGDGTPVNISGATFLMQLRRGFNTDVVETFTVSIVSAVSGNFRASLTDTVTATLSGQYVYDIKMTLGGIVSRELQGVMVVSKEVSRT